MSNGREENFLIGGIRRMGASFLFLFKLLGECVPAFARPSLIIAQIYNAGGRSLIIIMLCGLFVGMVLGLQGFQ